MRGRHLGLGGRAGGFVEAVFSLPEVGRYSTVPWGVGGGTNYRKYVSIFPRKFIYFVYSTLPANTP